jgi:hypothetical protein
LVERGTLSVLRRVQSSNLERHSFERMVQSALSSAKTAGPLRSPRPSPTPREPRSTLPAPPASPIRRDTASTASRAPPLRDYGHDDPRGCPRTPSVPTSEARAA